MKKSNQNILVSVLMSVYNDDEYVEQSILSILNQTYSNLEFIVINDGSSDNSIKIIEKYSKLDKRIKCYNQTNQGLTKSLNKGLKLCLGEYIFRQDADDISDVNRIKSQLDYMVQNDLLLCFSWFNVFLLWSARRSIWSLPTLDV